MLVAYFLSELYLVKLFEFQSDSNLTFNLTFQFNICKNIVGIPNMLTSVTFIIFANVQTFQVT